MPLTIHPDARKRLTEILVQALPSIKADGGMFIDRVASGLALIAADNALPGPLRTLQAKYINEYPLTNFILDTLTQELHDLNRYISDKTLALTDISEYSNPAEVVGRLLNRFESLPWTYRLTIPLPASLGSILALAEAELSISPSLRIVRPTDAFINQFPLLSIDRDRDRRSGNPFMSLFSLASRPQAPIEWSKENAYIQISADGLSEGTAAPLRLIPPNACFVPSAASQSLSVFAKSSPHTLPL
jgi:hypothetical protein